MALCDGAVHLFVCLSLKRVHKNAIFSKTKQLWSLLTSNRNYHNKLSKNPFWTPKIQNGGRPPYWKLFSAINQQPIVRFQWNFAWRSSFSQNLGTGTDRYRRSTERIFFCFPNAVWASIPRAGAFRIASDTLLLGRMDSSPNMCPPVDLWRHWMSASFRTVLATDVGVYW